MWKVPLPYALLRTLGCHNSRDDWCGAAFDFGL